MQHEVQAAISMADDRSKIPPQYEGQMQREIQISPHEVRVVQTQPIEAFDVETQAAVSAPGSSSVTIPLTQQCPMEETTEAPNSSGLGLLALVATTQTITPVPTSMSPVVTVSPTDRYRIDPTIQPNVSKEAIVARSSIVRAVGASTIDVVVTSEVEEKASCVRISGDFAIADVHDRLKLITKNPSSFTFGCSCPTHILDHCPFKSHLIRLFVTSCLNSLKVDTNRVIQHFASLWSVNEGGTVVVLVSLSNRRRRDGSYAFTCNGAGCKDDAACPHRDSILNDFDIILHSDYNDNSVDGSESAMSADQSQVVALQASSSRIPLFFDETTNDFKAVKHNDLLSRDLVVDLFPPYEGVKTSPWKNLYFLSLKPKNWEEWVVGTKNLNFLKIYGDAEPCHQEASCDRRFLIASEDGGAIISCDVCQLCHKCTTGADTFHQIFLCEEPKESRIGFGITVSLAQHFSQNLLPQAINIKQLFDNFTSSMADLVSRAEDKQLQGLLETNHCITYGKFQNAIYSCIAASGIMESLRSTSCNASHQGLEPTLVADACFFGPPQYKDLAKYVFQIVVHNFPLQIISA